MLFYPDSYLLLQRDNKSLLARKDNNFKSKSPKIQLVITLKIISSHL